MNEIRNILIGFELGERESQICYYDRKTGEPESIPLQVGTAQYTFPTILSKKPGKDEWHFGPEAEYFTSQHNDLYVGNIYELCQSREKVLLEGEEWEPGALLGIFLRQALRLLGVPDPARSVSSFMVTVPRITGILVEHLRRAFQELGCARDRMFLQSYEESFYYHTLYQRPELWVRKVGLFQFEGEGVSFSSLEIQEGTRPALVQVKRGKRISLPLESQERDRRFVQFIEESLGSERYSSLFLVGEGFDREWAKASVPLLCKNHRHVFYGSNLFAKGACYGAKEKVEERNLKNYLFLGEDMVRFQLGIEMVVSGSSTIYPLIPGGLNWYEAQRECELLLDGPQELVFLLQDYRGGEKRRCRMELPGLPQRPPKATRLRVRAACQSAGVCRITVEDLGLGELFPGSGLVWQEQIPEEE